VPGTITLDSTVVMDHSGLVTATVGEELFTMDIDKGLYLALDPVGKAVWDLAQAPIKVASLRDALMERYQVSPDQCLSDLQGFLADLLDRGRLRVLDQPDTDCLPKSR